LSEFIKSQQELRANLTHQIQESLDAAEERGGLDAETLEKVNRLEDEIRKADEVIDVARRQEERKAEVAEAARGFVPEAAEERSASDILKGIGRGEVRGHEFAREERATLVTSSDTVPQSFYDQVFQVARLVGPMLDTSEVINTTTGEDLRIPTITAYGTAAQTAAGSTI